MPAPCMALEGDEALATVFEVESWYSRETTFEGSELMIVDAALRLLLDEDCMLARLLDVR